MSRSSLPTYPLALPLLFALGLAACAKDEDVPDDVQDSDSDSEPARWPACDLEATTQPISFVHVNDMHGHYNPDTEGVIPVARTRAYFEEVRAEQPYTLFTDGGDDYEKGSVVEALSDYASTREVTEALQYDVRVIGNHDFAWSQEELLRFAADPHAIVLASNIEYIGNDAMGYGAVEYAELQVGCVTVGFFGMVSGPWTAENTPLADDFYDEFPTNLDFVSVARRLIDAHRDDVDLLVAVNHLGLGDDVVLANQTEGIDVILGGHSHTPMFASNVVNDTIIIQAGSYSMFVGRLDLTFDLTAGKVSEHVWQLRALTSDLAIDDATEEEVAAILQTYGPTAFDEIGQLDNGQGTHGAAILATRAAMATLDIDGAFMGDSAAFNGIPAGPVSQQNLFDAYLIERQPPGEPSWNATYTADLSGADLKKLSGLGDSWASVLPDPIDDSTTYTITLPNYAAQFPQNHLPEGISLSNVAFAKETWEVLDAYTRLRTADCLHLDNDTPLAGCP